MPTLTCVNPLPKHTFALSCPNLPGNEHVIYQFAVTLEDRDIRVSVHDEDDRLHLFATLDASSDDTLEAFGREMLHQNRYLASGRFEQY